MIIFYASRVAARAVNIGALVDNGPSAPKGKRYGRKLSAISGNSRQRRRSLRAILSQTH